MKHLKAKSTAKKKRGFTIVELMIVIALLAVMVSVGVPAFLNFTQTNTVAATANRFMSSLALAKSEAIKRNTNITVCRFVQTGATTFTCTNDGLWEQGWGVWVDQNTNGVIDNTEWIKREAGLPVGYTLRSSTNNFVSSVTFNSGGDASGDFGSNADILRLCEASGDLNRSRGIRIDGTGRATVINGTAACP